MTDRSQALLREALALPAEERADVAAEFLEAIDNALKFIARWPEAGSPVPNVSPDLPVRRAPVRRFPYHIVHLEMSDVIRILAFAHDRRSPGSWHSRTLKK